MPTNAPERILIVKLSAIGDVLMATPAARAVREAYPNSYIAWIVERKSADIVLGNPYLDEVIVWDRTKSPGLIRGAARFIKSIAGLSRELRARKFDVCVDLQGLLRSAGVCLVSGAKRRIGFSDGAEGSVYLYHETYDPGGDEVNAQQRNLDLLKTIGVRSTNTAMHMPVGDDDRVFAKEFFEASGIDGQKVVAFCPATTWVNKHWTPEGWSQVADLLHDKYNTRSLILGSKADIDLAGRIVDGAKCQPIVSAGKTTLKQAGALMERCLAVIGVDTGLLHMSVALDRPTVGLFGASAWRCFQKKANFVWVAKDFPCSPCRRHPICNNVDCMQAIGAEDVENAVARWLE
ncbi:MAG: glycosyltransferase family 9 protein [Armatimonadota bacterium]|nr:glycosyltransferase family 9 protein [bacterium]